jgi:hypothetical protein
MDLATSPVGAFTRAEPDCDEDSTVKIAKID